MDNKQIFEMADELKSAKEYKKDLEAQVKEVNAWIDELDKALSDAMAESELHELCEAPADQGQKALPDRDKDFPEEGDQLGGHCLFAGGV